MAGVCPYIALLALPAICIPIAEAGLCGAPSLFACLPCLAETGCAGAGPVIDGVPVDLYRNRFACRRAGRVAGADAEAVCALPGGGAEVQPIELQVDARGMDAFAINY